MSYVVISIEEARERLIPGTLVAWFGNDEHSRKYAQEDCDRLNQGKTKTDEYAWSKPTDHIRGWCFVNENDLAPATNEYGEICP